MANELHLPHRRLVLVSASALALSACGGLGLGPTDTNDTIYLLQPSFPAAPGGQPTGWALAVDIPNASDSLDSRRIALINPDATLDYYAGAVWADRLPKLVQTALVAAFQASGRVRAVARTEDALHADYELLTELRDCAAHYSAPDGIPSVGVNIIAQMSTAHGRNVVASFAAKQDAAASQNSTAAAVAAFNTALGAAVGQIVGWAQTLPPPPGS
jgi:cholesterol transport system auxiliary component